MKINLYVFGHYDSRGGTVGVRVNHHGVKQDKMTNITPERRES